MQKKNICRPTFPFFLTVTGNKQFLFLGLIEGPCIYFSFMLDLLKNDSDKNYPISVHLSTSAADHQKDEMSEFHDNRNPKRLRVTLSREILYMQYLGLAQCGYLKCGISIFRDFFCHIAAIKTSQL